MGKHKAKITAKSIEQSGLPQDYKKVIAEYIWNGFDAGATEVHINYSPNELGHISEFSVYDNGTGISFSNIDETFGQFLDSQKASSFNTDGFVKGKKGKGRYSFRLFCNKAIWSTCYKDDKENFINYDISISRDSQDDFDTKVGSSSKKGQTGTTVLFHDLFDFSAVNLECEGFMEFLSSEFGWFLFLNRRSAYRIVINGNELEYNHIICDQESFLETVDEVEFEITYLHWSKKIGDKYFYYFLNSDKKEAGKKHTSYNNKGSQFHHSVYVVSAYFDAFRLSNSTQKGLDFKEKDQNDQIFKSLTNKLNQFLSEKEKNFIRNQKADDLINDYRVNGIFPKFRNNQYDEIRKKDLENVVKEIFSIQPKIFQGLKTEASKTLVGFLNLLLDSDEREKILEIMEQIVSLSHNERVELAEALSKTKISSITSIIKMLESRFIVVESLKRLIFDLEKFTTERDHIQKIIECNYWLFGEQFHLVSSDKNFEVLLNNYMHFLEENGSFTQNIKLDDKRRLRRPDIFICRQRDVPDATSNENLLNENIIIELKRPSVIIGKDQYSQIEDYMRFIIQDPKFNSQLRRWKFFIVGKKVDSFIEDKYESNKNKGKRYLVESVRNYEIYAMTWDDLFKIFDQKHKNFIDKLSFKDSVMEELCEKGLIEGRELSNEITKMIVNR